MSVITRPGKFQGEEEWVPYMYECELEGFATDTCGEYSYFEIDEEQDAFPCLRGVRAVVLHHRSDGFVHGFTISGSAMHVAAYWSDMVDEISKDAPEY